jgi:deoxyadenosine/deoxycytidine kinase
MTSLSAAIVMRGMEQIKHYISIQGSIGAGKSTLLRAIRKFISFHRCDATEPSHIDEHDPKKNYYLIIDEPVGEWTKKKYEMNGQIVSILDEFYKDMQGMALPFQIVAFTSRIQCTRQMLNKIVPTSFKRNIIIISERSMSTDRLFFHNLCETMPDMSLSKSIYDEFFTLICDEMLKQERAMIYLPVSPNICFDRVTRRARLEETENGISEAYLSQLDEKHMEMIRDFKGKVFRVDEFQKEMASSEIEKISQNLMLDIEKYVAV